MELSKISVILIGMDIHMILGEAWNVIPSKCQKFVPTAIVVVVVVEVGVLHGSGI